MTSETKVGVRAFLRSMGSVDIFWVSLLVVGVYYLPLLVALSAAVATNFYTVEADPAAVGVPRLLEFFQSFARDSLATLFVPLITTYTILRADVSGKVPIQAFVLMAIFLIAFLLAMYLFVKIDPSLLARHGIPDLSDTLKSYAKESLTFVALVLGGTAKRS